MVKMMDKRNSAYDLSLFEDKPKKRKERSNVVKMPRKKWKIKTKRRLKLGTVLYTAIISSAIVSIFSVMIYGQVQLTELTDKINSSNKVLAESQSTYTQLKMKAESEFSLSSVEEYAENELFMRKIEPSQIEYIVLSNGDKAEIKNDLKKDSILDKIKNMF